MENKKSESYNEVMKELAIKKFLKCSGITSSPRRSIFKESPVCEEKKKSIEKQADLKKLALKELRVNPPLMYLTNEESTTLVDESKVEIVDKDTWLVTLEDPEDAYEAFFIVKGEAYVFNDEGYLELLPKGTFFGVDGTLFRRRFYGIKAGEDLIVMRIAPEILTKYLKKDSKLTMNISRNMVRKHNIFEPLIQFKSYVRQLKSGASFDKAALINYYKAINSALHPMCNSSDLDIDSWLYANRRLPNNITSTLVFFITTKCPEVLSHPDVALPVKTTSRPRQIFQTMPGKCVAILRDLETDLFDMLSNLCIHIVECKKVLKKLRSPALFRDLLMCRGDQTRVISILQTTDLTDEEIKGLSKIWPNNLGENLANILMHYNDFTMTIQAPSSHLKLDATECWVKKLWFATTDLLKLSPETSCESIPDDEMTIDIVQGSRRAFANMISPYIYVHRADIMKWAAETNPKLITKHFNCEEDRLYAYSYYYFLNHTECAEERQKLEVENGILKLDQPDTTGVAITLVDCSKLKKEYCDPAITPKPATKYHVIINIGYTFGVQSSDIIRSMMNLFGRKIRSINIIGKAGGMTGNKGDLLLATRIHSDESFEVVNNNLGNLDTKLLERTAGRPVHVGPMLTVAGTILQNSLLLNYFKKLCHCVGLEMEGLHFAREIKRYTELGIVRNDVISRFAYYISDLPLDPCSNLRYDYSRANQKLVRRKARQASMKVFHLLMRCTECSLRLYSHKWNNRQYDYFLMWSKVIGTITYNNYNSIYLSCIKVYTQLHQQIFPIIVRLQSATCPINSKNTENLIQYNYKQGSIMRTKSKETAYTPEKPLTPLQSRPSRKQKFELPLKAPKLSKEISPLNFSKCLEYEDELDSSLQESFVQSTVSEDYAKDLLLQTDAFRSVLESYESYLVSVSKLAGKTIDSV
eukprot:TRINITY_DN2362_c0_g1_i1.p2 TRINITY_DN2362_c0_g1~~TRINITY_DN2362_c0_g1_i1.p2  ORF type:complete len:925 (-),score=72.83 TRINITY_DN2362_c0_g1_i1:14366-17140(-)